MEYSRKRLSTQKEASSLSLLGILKNSLIFFLVFVGICISLSVILSVIFYNFPNPVAYTEIIATASLFIASFVSAFLLSKKTGQKYLLGGLFLGLIIVFVLFVGSLFTDTKILSAEFLLKLLVPALCVLGALLGIKREKRVKRKRHHR